MHPVRIATLFCLTSLWACAPATLQVGDTASLSGRIALKGSDPHPIPVLVTADRDWELRGLSREQAMSWQSRQATVTGTVLGTGGPDAALRPRLDVQAIR